MLNMKPQRISASVLHSFLTPTSPSLYAAYPRQFRKLLRAMQAKYIPLLRRVVGGEEGSEVGVEERAAISVLESYVETTLAAIASGATQT